MVESHAWLCHWNSCETPPIQYFYHASDYSVQCATGTKRLKWLYVSICVYMCAAMLSKATPPCKMALMTDGGLQGLTPSLVLALGLIPQGVHGNVRRYTGWERSSNGCWQNAQQTVTGEMHIAGQQSPPTVKTLCTENETSAQKKCSLASGKRLWANETAGERGSALV